MKDKVKVVARIKNGEVLKGYASGNDLESINNNKSVYIELVKKGNTVGTIINQDQLEGLFIVKTFDGNKPGFFTRMYFDSMRVVKDNFSMICAAVIIGVISITGLIALV